MFFKIYGLLALMVFCLAIKPLWKDTDNSKTDPGQWLFLALAMVFSPVVLPNMIFQRFKKSARPRSLGLDNS